MTRHKTMIKKRVYITGAFALALALGQKCRRIAVSFRDKSVKKKPQHNDSPNNIVPRPFALVIGLV